MTMQGLSHDGSSCLCAAVSMMRLSLGIDVNSKNWRYHCTTASEVDVRISYLLPTVIVYKIPTSVLPAPHGKTMIPERAHRASKKLYSPRRAIAFCNWRFDGESFSPSSALADEDELEEDELLPPRGHAFHVAAASNNISA